MECIGQVLPSIQERNPYMKDQVGNAIYGFVEKITGQLLAPRVTGMMIEIKPSELQQELRTYHSFHAKVIQAVEFLRQEEMKL